MAASRKYQFSFSSLKSVVHFQQWRRFSDTLIEARSKLPNPTLEPPMLSDSGGHVDYSKWQRLDSRLQGIPLWMIPDSSRTVLKTLQSKGHDAYLVGGCVRDLLLNRAPKDFDVVTTASLTQIKKVFHRASIVGRKFPICMVHVNGSVIEVSSFETVARKDTEKDDVNLTEMLKAEKEDVNLTEMPKGYDTKDALLWKDSVRRDFTINSMFYDPYADRIYDYNNGITDLRGMELRTSAPAHLSFKEDRARIVQGIRIAARLGFSFSNDTEKAIHRLHASVMTLTKGRLRRELDFMLSYGAAEPSLSLLKRFKILEFLLPFQAAYLNDCNRAENNIMLMYMKTSKKDNTSIVLPQFLSFKHQKNLDRVTSCDQPCTSRLWFSLLAFHLALVNNPQDAIVVLAFSSILYHGSWEEGLKAAREQSIGPVHFTPEIFNTSCDDETDEALSRRVDNFASKVRDSIYMLTDSKSVCKVMRRLQSSRPTKLVLISKGVHKGVNKIFCRMTEEMESSREKRCFYNINYDLLGKGDTLETRFALRKIIIDTMRYGLMYGQTEEEVKEVKVKSTSPISKLETPEGKDGAKHGRNVLDEQRPEPKAKDVLHTPKPKVKKVQVEKSTSKLESLKGKDEAKRGRSVIDEQKHQPKPKKQKANTQTIDSEQNVVKGKMVPQWKIQLKDQHPRNASSLSNTYKRDKNREEKQATVGDKSVGVKVVRKLSGLFR